MADHAMSDYSDEQSSSNNSDSEVVIPDADEMILKITDHTPLQQSKHQILDVRDWLHSLAGNRNRMVVVPKEELQRGENDLRDIAAALERSASQAASVSNSMNFLIRKGIESIVEEAFNIASAYKGPGEVGQALMDADINSKIASAIRKKVFQDENFLYNFETKVKRLVKEHIKDTLMATAKYKEMEKQADLERKHEDDLQEMRITHRLQADEARERFMESLEAQFDST